MAFVRPSTTYFVRHPSKLTKKDLAAIVDSIQAMLYSCCDERGEFWSVDKEVAGSELVDFISMVFREFELVPVLEGQSVS